MKTQKEVRESFWSNYPEFKNEYRTKKRQNDYCCDIRCAFCDYLDHLLKNGEISEKQAGNYTL